jgi:hypothetical protein
MLENLKIRLVAIGGHDTSDEVLAILANWFADRYQQVSIGSPILVK